MTTVACRIPNIKHAFTLAESLVASVVLAILVLGICGSLGASYQQTDAQQQQSAALGLARELMDEISAKPLADPSTGSTTLGPGSGMTSRALYTHVTNYSGYSDTSTAVPLLEGGTVDVTGTQIYTRSVKVTMGIIPSVDTKSPTGNFALVTVTVTPPNGATVQLFKTFNKYTISR